MTSQGKPYCNLPLSHRRRKMAADPSNSCISLCREPFPLTQRPLKSTTEPLIDPPLLSIPPVISLFSTRHSPTTTTLAHS